ncbi:MAG: flagellar basal body L-ring protein FlgH [bacterium]|jgi:flagellar L-ring protein precursor FlgH
MNKYAVKTAIAMLFFAIVFGGIPGRADSLFPADSSAVDLYHRKPKKYRPGDIILVKIDETALAQTETTTGLSGEHKTDVDFTNTGILDAVLSPLWRLIGLNGKLSQNTKNEYDGKGDTDRKGKLSATVSVLVVDVLEDGNLVVEGRKEVKVNHETQILVISGVVRPQDIDQDNTIPSNRLADTRVEYVGEGALSKKMKPGFISRVFDILF